MQPSFILTHFLPLPHVPGDLCLGSVIPLRMCLAPFYVPYCQIFWGLSEVRMHQVAIGSHDVTLAGLLAVCSMYL